MRQIMILALTLTLACTPKPDSGEDSVTDTACDTGDSGLPSACEPRVWYWDADGDGYGLPPLLAEPVQACTQPEGYASTDGDCDDSNADTYPGASDLHGDNVDSDCDGIDG